MTTVPRRRRLLVGVSGSVAVINLPQYLLPLQVAHDLDIRVVMTPSAQRFLPLHVAGLFAQDVVSADDEWRPGFGHVELATWADAFMVLPASATTIAALASGTGSGLLAGAALAHPRPLLVFPNMNAQMWGNKAVQRNVAVLRGDGHVVVEPELVEAYTIATRTTSVGAVVPVPDVVCKEFEAFYQAHGPRTLA